MSPGLCPALSWAEILHMERDRLGSCCWSVLGAKKKCNVAGDKRATFSKEVNRLVLGVPLEMGLWVNALRKDMPCKIKCEFSLNYANHLWGQP